jgi:RNA polymerase subunit RPABC4/transcription elongation factor Spt4
MVDPELTTNLVACKECGGAHRIANPAGDDSTCPRCGNDSFTDIRDPSSL